MEHHKTQIGNLEYKKLISCDLKMGKLEHENGKRYNVKGKLTDANKKNKKMGK